MAEAFIGVENLQIVANNVGSNIIMGAAYAHPDDLSRLGIHVLTGLQYKHAQLLLLRKGGTTRRKKVGSTIENKVGYLEERVLEVTPSWNRVRSNVSQFFEVPTPIAGTDQVACPLAEATMAGLLMNYADDLWSCVFWGNVESSDETKNLYQGLHAYANKDIEAGTISVENNNLIKLDAITAPVDANDTTAWKVFEEFINKLSATLRSRAKVIIACSELTGAAIAAAYANKWYGNKGVTYLENGNWTIDEHRNIEVAPSDVFGSGDRLWAYTPNNLEYGIDTDPMNSHVNVKVGSERDNDDIWMQIESLQGTRIIDPTASSFAMSDGSIKDAFVPRGDYEKDTIIVSFDSKMGSVTIDGKTPDSSLEYAKDTVVVLAATANEGYEFTKWSDGVTDATRNVVATGNPMGFVAIFKVKS